MIIIRPPFYILRSFLYPRPSNCICNNIIIRCASNRSPNKLREDERKSGGPPRPPEHEFRTVEPSGWLLLIIPIITFGLGVWQVFRWRWKLGLIEEMEKLAAAEAVGFRSVSLDKIDDLEYKKVRVKGRFDSTKDVLLGPRSLVPAKGEAKPQGLISQGQRTSGYLVISPFTVSDQNVTIMVNRGWVPSRKVEQFRADDDEVEIIGVVRGSERRSPFMSQNRPESGLWMFRDIPSLAKYFESSEFFLDLTACVTITPTPMEGNNNEKSGPIPVPCQTRVSLRNEHVTYFMTWFGLSGLTSYMWYKMYRQKKRLR